MSRKDLAWHKNGTTQTTLKRTNSEKIREIPVLRVPGQRNSLWGTTPEYPDFTKVDLPNRSYREWNMGPPILARILLIAGPVTPSQGKIYHNFPAKLYFLRTNN